MLILLFPRRIEATCTPNFFPKFSSSNVLPAQEDSPGISISARCKSWDNKRPAYSGFFSPRYSARTSLERRFWKKRRSINIDCFFKRRDHTISNTTSTATPIIKPIDALNNPDITKITNSAAIIIRITIVETKGARFVRLSCHKVTNSTEWFFFTIIARKKGAIHRITKTAPNSDAQKWGKFSLKNGTTKRKERAMIDMLTIE